MRGRISAKRIVEMDTSQKDGRKTNDDVEPQLSITFRKDKYPQRPTAFGGAVLSPMARKAQHQAAERGGYVEEVGRVSTAPKTNAAMQQQVREGGNTDFPHSSSATLVTLYGSSCHRSRPINHVDRSRMICCMLFQDCI